MWINDQRYGALTSASRTYFVSITGDVGENGNPNVNISRAYFVGEMNYLRVWAYLYHLGSQQDDDEVFSFLILDTERGLGEKGNQDIGNK